jgi:hypothetical protein
MCHACRLALRAEARRGLRAIEVYLAGWSELERALDEQE